MSNTNKLYYYKMLRIRMIEEEIARRYPEGKMRCPVHLSVGQEAAAVGICHALKATDKMVSTHRAHAHYLAKGGSLNGLIGELYGKQSGCSRGNGGSMHLIDLSCNFFGSTSIVGGTIPVGVGLAFSDHLKGKDTTTVVCLGDAAIEEGVFHEAANFASLHKLNVIFAVENNYYSCYTNIKDRQPSRPMKLVAAGHGLPYLMTAMNNVEDIVDRMHDLLRNGGPGFLEIPTFRHLQHCGPDNDDNLNYRSADMISWGHAYDPLKIPQHGFSPDEIFMNKKIIQQEIDEAFAYTERAKFPDPEEVGAYVYSPHTYIQRSY